VAMFPTDLVVVEHDGSINNGWEAITRPMSPHYFAEHKEEFRAALIWLSAQGYRSHQTSTCGLHIHVGREMLGAVQAEVDFTLVKILLIVERFWGEVVTLSRRSEASLDEWAARYNTEDLAALDQTVKTPAYNLGRYRAVNLTPPNTIEFRFFRGTLLPDTYFACIDLTLAIVRAGRELQVSRIHSARHLRTLLRKYMTPELDGYMKSRGL
jgi:hypothetical protein